MSGSMSLMEGPLQPGLSLCLWKIILDVRWGQKPTVLTADTPTASQHVPITSPLNTTLGFSSFRFCPPPCWSRWRWRVVSEQLITVMSLCLPDKLCSTHGCTLSVNCWQWADEIQTPPGWSLSRMKRKVQQWTCIRDQPLTPFITKLHRLRDTGLSQGAGTDTSYVSWAFRLQLHLPQIEFIYFRIISYNRNCFNQYNSLECVCDCQKGVKSGGSITELRADVYPAPVIRAWTETAPLVWCLL